MELTQASKQWATRPADERFLSLTDMHAHFTKIRSESRSRVLSTRDFQAVPNEDHQGLQIMTDTGVGFDPTHWAFGQLATLSGGPAGYLRKLPSDLAADCLNYGLRFNREVEEVGLLLQSNGTQTLRAATGPKYGRIHNNDILRGLVNTFGDGVTGDWKVPGEFGKAVEVTKDNTTLYAGDRDMFVFLADEENRIEVPNRRNGQSGLMARGFFIWNSEVGSSTFGISTFVFDYACSNRIVWGADNVKEIKIRHTAGAPHRFLEQIAPAIRNYANSSSSTLLDTVEAAKKAKIDDMETFLANRFSKRLVPIMAATHMMEEGRPIETLWDATVAATAVAKTIEWQDERVELERKGGDLLTLAAKSI